MNAVCLIQARSGGTRLPGKVLAELYAGRSVLQHVYDRCSGAMKERTRVLTTLSDTVLNDALVAWGIPYVAVDAKEDDLLDRYYQGAKAVDADVVVRVTADCPWVPGSEIHRVLGRLYGHGLEYAANVVHGDGVRGVPDGWDVEAFTFRELARVAALPGINREHPTLEMEPVKWFGAPPEQRMLRCTIDTPEDLAWMRMAWQRLGVRHPSQQQMLQAMVERSMQGRL